MTHFNFVFCTLFFLCCAVERSELNVMIQTKKSILSVRKSKWLLLSLFFSNLETRNVSFDLPLFVVGGRKICQHKTFTGNSLATMGSGITYYCAFWLRSTLARIKTGSQAMSTLVQHFLDFPSRPVKCEYEEKKTKFYNFFCIESGKNNEFAQKKHFIFPVRNKQRKLKISFVCGEEINWISIRL